MSCLVSCLVWCRVVSCLVLSLSLSLSLSMSISLSLPSPVVSCLVFLVFFLSCLVLSYLVLCSFLWRYQVVTLLCSASKWKVLALTRQDYRQDGTRQDNTAQHKTTEDKTKKTRQHKATEDETRQDKTRLYKTIFSLAANVLCFFLLYLGRNLIAEVTHATKKVKVMRLPKKTRHKTRARALSRGGGLFPSRSSFLSP